MPEILDLKESPMPGIAQELLALSIGYPTKEKIGSIYRDYLHKDSRSLFALRHGDSIIGVIGIEVIIDGRAEVHHIGIIPQSRNSGFGKILLFESIKLCDLKTVEAETDKGAVVFYRKCGFEINSLGEKFPGIERFRCIWNDGAEPDARGNAQG